LIIEKVKVVPYNGGVHVETVASNGTSHTANLEAAFGLVFAAQMADFFDACLEVEEMTSTAGGFLPRLSE
jgi:hypothetical protein